MSKNEEKVEEEHTKDEQTAKFLHKLAEVGKECGLPKCLTAQYEKSSWDNLKTDVPRFNCDKCGCPPPPPIDKKFEDFAPTKVCRNCEHLNGKSIGLKADIQEIQLKEEAARRQEEKKAQKRSAPSEDDGDDDVIVAAPKPVDVVPEVVAIPQPPRQMPRKVAPQISRMEREKARMAREVANKQNPKMSKKPKLVTEKEPEFLQQLFGIGAKPS